MIDGLKSTEVGAIAGLKNPAPVAAKGRMSEADRAELLKQAKNFESILMNMMLKSMRSTITKNDYFNGGHAEEIWTGMLDQNLSSLASKHGHGFGLAEKIVKQLTQKKT